MSATIDAPYSNETAASPETSIRGYWLIVWLVLALAAGLRISLAVVNRQANDDHKEVVELVLQGRTGLTKLDCHECFHPKFFYYVCAGLFEALGLNSDSSRIVAAQLLNSATGLIVLGFVFWALHESVLEPKWRLWVFALVAINPRFIAINGQFSNDSFAILFGTVASFATLKLLTPHPRPGHAHSVKQILNRFFSWVRSAR